MTLALHDALDLLDWKRQVFAAYADVRAAGGGPDAWRRWRATRDRLFATHPQSPLPAGERPGYPGVPVFDHDPALRVLADVEPAPDDAGPLPTSGAEAIPLARVGIARFAIDGVPAALEVFWLDQYGGGLFVPFADATSGRETYGGGRYLLDTVKGADLGTEDGRLVLDFNFAYNPSCSYDAAWHCPLPPPANRLPLPVRAGERTAT